MFQYEISTFGTYQKVHFWNAQGDEMTIVPDCGANLLDLKFGGVSVLDGFQTPEALAAGDWGRSIVLVPFPNRLRDGKYSFEGKNYQFSINNADTNNAIHGLGMQAPMQIATIETTEAAATLVCKWQYDGSDAAYPFPFLFQIAFILRGGALDMKMSITNNGTHAIPAGLGWHPYFRIAEKSDMVSLKMPEADMIEIDERMLPTGIKKPFDTYKNMTLIGNDTLDNGFLITEKGTTATTTIEAAAGKLSFWQQLDTARFVQVFTPPHRQSIAIEPMTCNIDAFNNNDGLVILEPNNTLDCVFGMCFQQFSV